MVLMALSEPESGDEDPLSVRDSLGHDVGRVTLQAEEEDDE